MAPAERKDRAGSHRKSLRERVGALRNLPPFLRQIWATSPRLAVASLSLRVVRALLPIATLYIGKLIIDEAVRLAGHPPAGVHTISEWYYSGALRPLLSLLALEFGLAVLDDVLGRIVSLVDSLLSELLTNATSIALMEHAATLDLEDFEDSELQDKLDRARRQTMSWRIRSASSSAGSPKKPSPPSCSRRSSERWMAATDCGLTSP